MLLSSLVIAEQDVMGIHGAEVVVAT